MIRDIFLLTFILATLVSTADAQEFRICSKLLSCVFKTDSAYSFGESWPVKNNVLPTITKSRADFELRLIHSSGSHLRVTRIYSQGGTYKVEELAVVMTNYQLEEWEMIGRYYKDSTQFVLMKHLPASLKAMNGDELVEKLCKSNLFAIPTEQKLATYTEEEALRYFRSGYGTAVEIKCGNKFRNVVYHLSLNDQRLRQEDFDTFYLLVNLIKQNIVLK